MTENWTKLESDSRYPRRYEFEELETKVDSFQPLQSFVYKDTVADYAALSALTGLEVGDGYVNAEDGLVYVWNGTSFPADGDGLDVSMKPIGVVEEGNEFAVSGGEVYMNTASKSTEKIVFGDFEENEILPYVDYINQSFPTQNGDDSYLFDVRNVVENSQKVGNVDVIVDNNGIIAIALLDIDFNVIEETEYSVTTGLNSINYNKIVSQRCYVAIRTKTSYLKLNADTSGFFRKKLASTGVVTSVDFRLAYEIEVFTSSNGLLPEVSNLNDVVLYYNEVKVSPYDGYIDQTFTTNTGATENIHFDSRNVFNPKYNKNLKVKCRNTLANTCNVILLGTDYSILKVIPFTANNTISSVSIDTSDVTEEFIVAIQPILSPLRIGAETNDYSFRLSGGVVTKVNYRFGYDVTYNDNSNALVNKVDILYNQINNTDFDIYNEIATKDYIQLPPHQIDIATDLIIPNGKTIVGIKGKSIINCLETCRYGINIGTSNDVRLQDFVLKGSAPDTPVSTGMNPVLPGIVDSFQDAINLVNIGNQTGIRLNGGERIVISGLEIKNFSEFGFHVSLTGKKYQYALNFHDNYIHDNYCGIKTDLEAERSFYTDNYVTINQIGMYIDSGTNDIKGMSLNANRVGMVLSNGLNHAHGLISNLQITHCSLLDLITNNISLGQNFDNCKFGFNESNNNIYLYKSIGINFTNCQLVTRCGITIDGVNDINPTYDNSFVNCFSNSGNVTVSYINSANTLRLKGNWSMNPANAFNTNFNN